MIFIIIQEDQYLGSKYYQGIKNTMSDLAMRKEFRKQNSTSLSIRSNGKMKADLFFRSNSLRIHTAPFLSVSTRRITIIYTYIKRPVTFSIDRRNRRSELLLLLLPMLFPLLFPLLFPSLSLLLLLLSSLSLLLLLLSLLLLFLLLF